MGRVLQFLPGGQVSVEEMRSRDWLHRAHVISGIEFAAIWETPAGLRISKSGLLRDIVLSDEETLFNFQAFKAAALKAHLEICPQFDSYTWYRTALALSRAVQRSAAVALPSPSSCPLPQGA